MRRVQTEEPTLAPAIAARLRRNDAGLVPAVVQDAATGDVLMMAWMD
ncbi:phosphoribosyl-AMP cyclohydrolase, partial [Escherichia coli]|nr:phosphoribosyl-AMP cyclohydrolase [Escherichia coli]